MTKEDLFAAIAMIGLIQRKDISTLQEKRSIADHAFDFAKVMCEEAEVRGPGTGIRINISDLTFEAVGE